MATSLHTFIQALRIFAGVLAVISLVGTVVYVRDRDQRRSLLLLGSGLLCLVAAPMLDNFALAMTVTGIATVLVISSAILNFRILRARSD